MIPLYLFFSALSLFNARFFFAPLFLFTALLLFKKKWLCWGVLLFSLLVDLFAVRPLGITGLFYTLFLFTMYLYGQKYNLHNTLFLSLFLLCGSGVYWWLAKVPFHWVSMLVFGVFMLVLSLHSHEVYKSQVRAL